MLFLSLLKLNFIKSFQYRGSMIINFFGAFIALFVEISLWLALFRVNPVVKSTTFNDMINYMALTALLSLFSMAGPGYMLSERISNGSISTDFIRPYNLKLYLLSQSLGNNTFYFLTFTLPVYTVVLLIYGIKFQFTLSSFIIFIISVINGSIISFFYSYILGMFPFWLQSTWYIRWVESAFFNLFAGSFVPLWFYPHILNKISYYLPFRYITYEPIAFYLGRTNITSMIGVIKMQILWIVILVTLEAFLWRKAQKRIMVYGG